MFKGQRYCLTQLCLGLNVALLIMRRIIDFVMSQEKAIKNVMSMNTDDIYVYKNLVPIAHVSEHLSNYVRGSRKIGKWN